MERFFIRIDDTYPHQDKIIDEIRRKVSEVRGLPVEVGHPVLREHKSTNIPILKVALYGRVDPLVLKMEAENLKDFLKFQEGVQSVSYSGLSDLQLKILVNPERLSQFDITLNEIFSQLSDWSRQIPGGLFESRSQVANLTVGTHLSDINHLNNFVIRSNDSDKSVKLSDVAEMEFGLESSQTESFFKGKKAVLLTIIKKPFMDSIDVVENLNAKIKGYKSSLGQGLNIDPYEDQSIVIRDKLRVVILNAVTGLCLVLALLFFFLDWRSSIVTSLGIPIAILGGICVLYFLGQTMNSLVILGIIISLGMLVDDAIVICENIYSYLEKGLSPYQASLRGAYEIARPVIASVLTTIFAFLPIIFMKGIIGQFLMVIPLAVVSLLSFSLLEALLILPIHAKEVMRTKVGASQKSRFRRMEKVYKRYVGWSIDKRGYLLATFILFMVLSGMSSVQIFKRFSLFPRGSVGGFSLELEMEKNTSARKTKEMIQDLDDEISPVVRDVIEASYSTVGGEEGGHRASLKINFTTDFRLSDSQEEVIEKVRAVVKDFKEKRKVQVGVSFYREGPPSGKPIAIHVTSRDFNKGEKVIETVKGELKKIEGVHSLETDLSGDSIRYQLRVNNELAVSEGIDPKRVARTIFMASTGQVISEILDGNQKVEVLLKVQGGEQDSIQKVLELRVRNKSGQAVPLERIVEVSQEKGPSAIKRLDGLRTISLFGEVEESLVTGKEVYAQINPLIEELRKKYPAMGLSIGGREKNRMSAFTDTIKLYGFTLLLIFMTISLTFQSLIYPFLILTTIPMGFSGVIWALIFHGKPLSLMGIIGMVGLSGVVVNVSIILLKFIQERLLEGVSLREAIISASVKRLRPIIITTTTTLLGLIPTIYGIGGFDSLIQPIALVLGWGLFCCYYIDSSLFAINNFFLFYFREERKEVRRCLSCQRGYKMIYFLRSFS